MAKGVKEGWTGAGAATAKRGWGRAVIKGVVAISVFVMFSGLIVYAYNKGKEAGSHSGKPRIKIFEDGFRTPTIRNCRGCHIWPHEQHDTAKPVFQHPEENCVDCHLTQVVEAVPAEAKPAPDAEGRKAFSHIRHVGGHEIPRDDMALCLRCHQQADTSTSSSST